jgi:hypothetical protein
MSSCEVNWLSLISETIVVSPSFLKVLDEKLVEHAYLLTGINLRNGQYGLLPLDSGFEIHYKLLNQFNVGVLQGYLVGPDAFGYPATAIWYCPSLPNQAIEPNMEVTDNCQLEIFWAEFPIDELCSHKQETIPLVELSTELYFKLEWKLFSCIDVYLLLQMQNAYSQEQILHIKNAINETLVSWNEQSDNEVKVHYISDVKLLTDTQIEFHIDFGSADNNIFILLIQKLDSIAQANYLEKVIFHN